MADVTENDLRAAIKALVDVVAPSVLTTDPLANEQLRLVIESLEFIRTRLNRLYDRDRFELSHHLAMSRALKGLLVNLSPATAALFDRTLAIAEQVETRAGASTDDLKAATAGLAAAARELIRESASMPAAVRSQVDRCVLACSEERIAFDRAWYLPLGFDPAPSEVRSLDAILNKVH